MENCCSLTEKGLRLRDRAAMMGRVREFFACRSVMEVDCPMLTSAASIDAHIDLIAADTGEKDFRFLHTSPEYAMKRLLAQGIGDIYQLGHVFRRGERGRRHMPEFTMAEWYRCALPFTAMIEETADFIRLFLGDLPLELISYGEAFLRYAGCDVDNASCQELASALARCGIEAFSGGSGDFGDREALVNQLLAVAIEPNLGSTALTALWGYPPDQAALARTCLYNGKEVAERFEIYHKGVELCNGYHELIDAAEQRRRFHKSNRQRACLGKALLPLDELFLAALELGMPDSCGVAVGFDRLMMLRHSCSCIDEILPFSWEDI